jgi:Leucine-rich repeat (LRR) protein
MTARRTLTIRHTELTTLPDSVWHETALELLNISNNRLTAIPDQIGNLQQLRLLDLAHDALTRLPETIGDLRGLCDDLYVHDNQIMSIPSSIRRSRSVSLVTRARTG